MEAKEFDRIQNTANELKKIFERDNIQINGMWNYLVRAVEEAQRLTPLALDFCPLCDDTGFRRLSPTLMAHCSCPIGQSQ